MFEFLQNNIGTIIVGGVLLAVIVFAAWRMIADKKQGKSSCGCGCGSCPNSSLCHAKRNGGTE